MEAKSMNHQRFCHRMKFELSDKLLINSTLLDGRHCKPTDVLGTAI